MLGPKPPLAWVCLTHLLPLSEFLTPTGFCFSHDRAGLFHPATAYRVLVHPGTFSTEKPCHPKATAILEAFTQCLHPPAKLPMHEAQALSLRVSRHTHPTSEEVFEADMTLSNSSSRRAFTCLPRVGNPGFLSLPSCLAPSTCDRGHAGLNKTPQPQGVAGEHRDWRCSPGSVVSKGLAPPQHLVPSSGVIQRPFLRLVSGVSATSALARPPRLSAHEEPPPRTSAPRPGEPRNARARRLLSTSQWPPTCKPVSKPTGLQAKTSGEVYGKVLGLSTDESRTQASDGASSPTAKRRSCSQSGIGSR